MLSNVRAERVELSDDLADASTWEQQSELLPTVAKCPPSTAHAPELGRHQPEHLIANDVAIGVVEILEVVHVQHGNGDIVTEAHQPLVQRAAAWQPGELIPECHAARVLEDA